jgi:hypothetical protein
MVINKLAILILSFNGKNLLNRCLKSVQKQKYKDFDIFLIDNGSTDGTVSWVKKNFTNIKIIQIKENLGFTGGYNFGFKYLEDKKYFYEYYFVLSNDVVCDSILLKKCLNIFNKDSSIGIVSPAILNEKFIIDSCGYKLPLITGTPISHLGGVKYKRKNINYETFWVSGCSFIIRVDVLKRVNYFDDYFAYYEDVSLCWKVINQNYKIISCLSTYSIHLGSQTFGISSLPFFLSEKNRIIAYWQNLSYIAFIFLLPILIISRLFLITINYVSGNIFIVKTKGLFSGLVSFGKFNKNNRFSLSKDINAIKRSMLVKLYKK